MSDTETRVAEHYTTGALLLRVCEALKKLGVDPDAPTPEDLKPVDEFHTGGVQATDDLLGQLSIAPTDRVLDIGSGIGGTARHVAMRTGAHVTGVDLTPEFVETARELSALVGLADLTDFHTGSALALPVKNACIDHALLIHVGMNIEDKASLMTEARRALKPGGTFAIFDVMRAEDETSELIFPLPWSERPETSFVAPLAVYEAAAEDAGFTVTARRLRAGFALKFFEDVFARVAEHGPSPLGIHLMMRETAGEKLKNYVDNVKAGRIAPTELILKAV